MVAGAIRPARSVQGFTLIELMVTVAVMAILAMIAVPNFYTTLRRHQLQSAVGSLQGALAYARTEAVLRQYSVSICPSGGSAAACSGGNDYSQGWLIYTTPGAPNKVYATGGTMTLLRVGQGESHASAMASVAKPISFGPQGQVVGGAAAGFEFCGRTGSSGNGQSTAAVPGRVLTVSAQGSVYVQVLGVLASCAAPAV